MLEEPEGDINDDLVVESIGDIIDNLVGTGGKCGGVHWAGNTLGLCSVLSGWLFV